MPGTGREGGQGFRGRPFSRKGGRKRGGDKVRSYSKPRSGERRDFNSVAAARAAAEAAIADARLAHDRLLEALDILPQGIVFLDKDGRYILWNKQYADIYKRSADLFRPGAKLEDTLRIGVARGDYPDAIGREDEWLKERLDRLHDSSGRHEQVLSDGRCVLIEERRTGDGGIIGLRVDITEMKRREASFRLLFEGNPVPMFVYALDSGRILAANEAAAAHYGFSRERLQSMDLAGLHDPVEWQELGGHAARSIEEQAGRTWRHRVADGHMIDVSVFARRLTYEGQAAVMIAAIDVTERKRTEERIAYMAHHDSLTGLPNRVMMRQRMEEMLSRSRRNGRGMAVLCIDLDNFKAVNDTLGHLHGDLLLQSVAARLRLRLREEDVVARLGGDEFAILQGDIAQPADVTGLAQRLLDAIGEPYDLDGHLVTVGASIGIAIVPGDGESSEELLKNADMALYRSKADGKGTYRFFEAAMDARVQARRRLELELRAALQTGGLDVHYQPLVNLGTGEVTGYEALMRWPHRERGMIPPAEFIPVAEETGLITQIGAFVLRRACTDAAQWPRPLTVSVNLSPLQFKAGNLYQVVSQTLKETGLSPARLELEITETLLLDKSGTVLATLHALRALGVRIAMDDFGTGYSSLSYLRSFPFDKIKIDRTFVRGMGASGDAQAIVRAIIGLGASLGMTITAEGVETENDLAQLRQEGCQEGQGYLFSMALPQGEVLAALGAAIDHAA
jgi:diguanylate cyclase (GGDEF)-like protein/PAS domain S-box-containing protein